MMTEASGRSRDRCRGVGLIAGGIISCLVGYFIGNTLIPKIIFKRSSENMCVDSSGHANYLSWVGSLDSFTKDRVMKITYWNITNKDDFLFGGKIPVVKEVGPYIYQFSTSKNLISFSSKDPTVKYKTLVKTKFDSSATNAACPACSENDKITTMNAAYLGIMMKYGGDKNFALQIIAGTMSGLIGQANAITGSVTATLAKFGNLSSTVFPKSHPAYPAGFGPWFSKENKTVGSALKGKLSKLNRTGYNTSEMQALYDVITSPVALGTTGNTVLVEKCKANATLDGCGYLFYLNVHQGRALAGYNESADPIMNAMLVKIQSLFCTNATKCLSVCPITFRAIAEYITGHLAKTAIHLTIDGIDFGPVMTRTAKQLTHGFVESRLKIPGVAPNGYAVSGYLPNNSVDDLSKIKSVTFYTCKSTSKAFQWAEYDDSTEIKESDFPAASKDFRNIHGYNTMFGLKNAISSCTTEQPSLKHSYTVFSSRWKSKIKIVEKGTLKVGDIFTNKFTMETQSLLKTNNMSVFVDGLVDMSSKGKSVPIVVSLPHFMDADPIIRKYFSTTPDASKHGTIYAIEPITGAPMKLSQRVQINVGLPEITVAAPRHKPFNITYKEKQGATFLKMVIPVFWLSVDVTASESQREKLTVVYSAIHGGCASMVAGPLLGGLLIIVGIILIARSSKFQVHSE